MNIAVILAGSEFVLGEDNAEQYIEGFGKPIISYCLNKYEIHK